MIFCLRTLLWLLLLGSLLSGCGFRPRGSVSELTDPGSVYLDVGRGVTIRNEIEAALRDRAFSIAPTRDDADILLRIVSEEESDRIVSVQRNGRVSELELNHSISMQIAQGDGQSAPRYDATQIPNRVEVRREYTYDERGVLGKAAEAEILREEMREELVRQIVLRTVASLAPTSVSALPINPAGWSFIARNAFNAVADLRS